MPSSLKFYMNLQSKYPGIISLYHKRLGYSPLHSAKVITALCSAFNLSEMPRHLSFVASPFCLYWHRSRSKYRQIIFIPVLSCELESKYMCIRFAVFTLIQGEKIAKKQQQYDPDHLIPNLVPFHSSRFYHLESDHLSIIRQHNEFPFLAVES